MSNTTDSPTPDRWPPGYTEHWIDQGHGECYWERDSWSVGNAHPNADECRAAAWEHYRGTRERWLAEALVELREAVIAHIVGLGVCEDMSEEDADDCASHCGSAACTYCEMNRLVSQ